MATFEQQLEQYAELIVKVGVNVQQGQPVFVTGSLEMAPLVRLVASKAYDAGASNVHVEWTDDTLTRLKFEKAADDVFTQFPQWEVEKRNAFLDKRAAFISIVSSNPDLLKGIDPQRIGNNQKASGKALERFRQFVQSDKVSWTVVAASTRAWAAKVFPDLSGDEGIAKLWDAIFESVRLNTPDPVAAWKEHNATLHKKVDVLNSKHFHKLHYTAPGTDLTIELPEKHLWVGAGSTNEQDVPFMANMPTEEVFTVPHKSGVNGCVSSTKPLSYGGNLINNFKVTFENGRIVKVEAEEGQDILQQLVDTDEGSHYLGEVALVPHESPISQSNVLFYNTLFDENASNHLAIGSGYAFNVEGGKTMSQEELAAAGVNISITHVDFMIGSAEMDIDGIHEDGTVEPIFRKGNWAI
ncbi:aminopeptidase [Paenibacillus apiarius]|uniref:Aminopeptidase n=1 Tax=Paenibacillus apiarius TaxID=46240 RepID=A0ABT4DQU0_9BACL|nr:aminopeptidase [Paenibacillus apiarius]MCY9516203.1 aminopeptidase [Paenibacillus apiarius]MCY9519737.1 aminopeptidase [Paenibacillus apiarius]MCY9555264.1 aminopeptidase [Paenibacillus apiarius]MCY9559377.1 aminopeptidase [Paenibacillus apiarius]MCY9682737.1 aminopeptidase [Paenibacillus apiarius]